MRQVVPLIDEEIPPHVQIDRLQQRDEQKCDQMQWIEPREPKHKEFPAADGSLRDRVPILPEEDEAADAPEDPHAEGSGIVERLQEAIERQALRHETDRLVGDKGE